MSLLSPVTAVVLGWIFLGQKIQGPQIAGHLQRCHLM
jgi:probable blue pigment (indigoidine) exporter